MGHGGTQYNDLVDEQIDALEAWIDYHQSGGTIGAPASRALQLLIPIFFGPSRGVTVSVPQMMLDNIVI
jgi:hypothetical protein